MSSDEKSLLERRRSTNLRHPNFLSRAASRAMWVARLLGESWGGACLSCGGARAASGLGGPVKGELGGEELGERGAGSPAERGLGTANGTSPHGSGCFRLANLARRRFLTFRAHLAATLFGAPAPGWLVPEESWVPAVPALGGLVVGPRVGLWVGVEGPRAVGCHGGARGFSQKAGNHGRARARRRTRGPRRGAGNQGRASTRSLEA